METGDDNIPFDLQIPADVSKTPSNALKALKDKDCDYAKWLRNVPWAAADREEHRNVMA